MIALVLLLSCDQFTSPARYVDDEYVITGLLYEGLPVPYIFVGKTISPYGDDFTDMNVPDADVNVYELNGETVVDTIQLIYLSLGNGIGVYVDTLQEKTISSDFSYKIMANIGNTTVFAETDVPQAVEIIFDEEVFTDVPDAVDFPDLVYDTADQEHPLIIKTGDNSSINLMFSFFCLVDFEDAPQYTITFGDHTTPDDEVEYENPNDGSPRLIEFFGSYLPALNESNGSYYITESGYSGAIVFYGNYEISIYSMSDNYYNYLYKTDGFKHGGIQNGYGYFGAVSGQKIYTEVVE